MTIESEGIPFPPADLLPFPTTSEGGSAVQFLKLFDPESDPIGLCVADVVGEFLRAHEARVSLGTMAVRSLEELQFALGSFASDLGQRPVDSLRQSELLTWLHSHPEWASPHTQARRMGCVVTCFRWAESDGLIQRCPFRRDSSTLPPLKPRAAIDENDYRPLFDLTKDPPFQASRFTAKAFRRSLWFLWETGARTCEMRLLRWEQTNLDKGVAVLWEHKGDATGEPRIIALPRKVVRYLSALKKRLNPAPTDLIFPNGRGRVWTNSTFGRQFRRYAQHLEMKTGISAYSLRHGFCVRCLETTHMGERQIADLMGQASTKYVSWYGKSSRRRFDYLVKLINELE